MSLPTYSLEKDGTRRGRLEWWAMQKMNRFVVWILSLTVVILLRYLWKEDWSLKRCSDQNCFSHCTCVSPSSCVICEVKVCLYACLLVTGLCKANSDREVSRPPVLITRHACKQCNHLLKHFHLGCVYSAWHLILSMAGDYGILGCNCCATIDTRRYWQLVS